MATRPSQEDEHKKLKAMAALRGQSIKDFVFERTLGTDETDNDALVELERLLDRRIEAAQAGVGLTRHELAHPAGVLAHGHQPANSPFEAEDDCNFTTDAEMVGRLGFAPGGSTPVLLAG